MFPDFKIKWKKIKGSLKDPIICLGTISVILFLTLVISPSPKTNRNPPQLINPLLAEESGNRAETFLDPTKKSGRETPDFLLIQNSSLRASTPPVLISPQVLGSLVEGYEKEDVQKVIVEYEVEPGDTLSAIAEKFNISLNTLLWANNLNQNSIIQPGQKLIVPPVTGVIHHVKAGDTISEIAQKYKGKIEEIIAFNELSSEGDIYVGDVLIIPNGVMPKPEIKSNPIQVPLASSYFIYPTLSHRISQGLHWYNAVDFAGQCGDPIFAAAAGQVLKVKLTSSTSRWAFGGAGNHLTILHPNGVVTMYGHILTSFVNPGDQVSQGQIIALMGGQPGTPGAGLSTGCHLHFGVSGARNPFAK
jgi:murein DD-endopeptidase MepM/ murein hydrolase activator NlpD